jgi:hypothetical protein
MTESEFRNRIVACARSWCGTKYHLNACLKGVGVDCGRLPLGVFRELGLTDEKIDVFSHDWFCHATEDAYKLRILRHAKQIAEAIAYPTLDAKPGCILLLRAPTEREIHWHGGIVTKWPFVVHAIYPAVQEIDASRHPMWMHKEVAVFDPWLKAQEQLAA